MGFVPPWTWVSLSRWTTMLWSCWTTVFWCARTIRFSPSWTKVLFRPWTTMLLPPGTTVFLSWWTHRVLRPVDGVVLHAPTLTLDVAPTGSVSRDHIPVRRPMIGQVALAVRANVTTTNALHCTAMERNAYTSL